MRNLSTSIILIVAIAGCATRSSMNQLNVGMTKAQVLDILGTPQGKEGRANIEVLFYELGDAHPFTGHTNYYVKVVDGKVDSFGERDDYDPNK